MIARHKNWSPDARLMARQLGGAWLCGSVLMGTVVWVFLHSERIVGPLPARSAAVCPEPLRGLPFALVAGILLRPWRANVVAGGLIAGLVAAGFLMVAGHPATQNVFALYAEYARSFFSGSSYSVLVY